MRRNWIKLYVDQCLRGTMMDEMTDPAERFVWFGFLLLAGDSPFEGKIALTDGIGYTDEQLGGMLKCDMDVIISAKEKMIRHNKIKMLKNNIIEIVNWKRYQSEYQRQRPHRNPEFIKLRERIKERDDYTCLNCHVSEDDLKVPLCIHHIDNDPSNNAEDNLITLCMRCHSVLYKKASHPTKENERKNQESKLKSKVQEQSARAKCDIEGERDIERDKEEEKKEKKITKTELSELRKKIILYFNETTGQNRKLNVKETNDFINGRLNDGRIFDDFKHVIDTKTAQWKGDSKMQRFIRPSTLFRPGNFEDYLMEPYLDPRLKKQSVKNDKHSRMAHMPDKEWDAVAKYLYTNKKEEKDVARFLAMTNEHYATVRDEWEASEKKPEEFVRMILAAEMRAKAPRDKIDYEAIPELELEKAPEEKEISQQQAPAGLPDPPDRGQGRRRIAGDSGYQQRHLDNFFDKWWDEHSKGKDKDESREHYMKLVRSGQYKPQDLFGKPGLVKGEKSDD